MNGFSAKTQMSDLNNINIGVKVLSSAPYHLRYNLLPRLIKWQIWIKTTQRMDDFLKKYGRRFKFPVLIQDW